MTSLNRPIITHLVFRIKTVLCCFAVIVWPKAFPWLRVIVPPSYLLVSFPVFFVGHHERNAVIDEITPTVDFAMAYRPRAGMAGTFSKGEMKYK
jgi:hypothetical protein